MNIGQLVYFAVTERIDSFRHKRYSSPEVQRYRKIILKGEVIEIVGNKFKAKLFGNSGFEKDGKEYVFNVGNIIPNPSHNIENELGKWIEYGYQTVQTSGGDNSALPLH